MFAKHTNETTLANAGRKFHRYVQPVKSLTNLKTIIKLLKIEQVLVGEIDNQDHTTLIVTENDCTSKAQKLVGAIFHGSSEIEDFYEKFLSSLKNRKIYMTVFAVEKNATKTHSLVLATAHETQKVTYLSVTEDDLRKAPKLSEV